MTWVQLGLVLIVGLLAGILVEQILGARRRRVEHEALERASEDRASLQTRLEEREAAVVRLERELSDSRRASDALSEDLAATRESRARLEAGLEGERSAAAEKLALFAQAEARLREAFQALSAEALRTNNRAFLDLAKAALGEFQTDAKSDLEARQKAVRDLVAPLEQSLRQADLKLQEVERERVGSYAALREQVTALAASQRELQTETANLVRALRTPSVRGRWGEIQLHRVVEMAGMLEHCDFFQQESAMTEEGRRRPDLLVRLPGGRSVIVDAKAPLSAYLEALEAPDEATREARMRDHSRQVREHMRRLGSKGYWDRFSPAPEFVVMFLPGETFFSAALQHDPSLIDHGVESFVIPASPTTLIALLRAVHYGWQQERVARSAQEIRDRAAELYDRLGVMAGHFEEIRKNLDRTVDAFNRAVGSLEHRVLVAARRLKELGAGTRDDLPAVEVIERSARLLQGGNADGGCDGDPGADEIGRPDGHRDGETA